MPENEPEPMEEEKKDEVVNNADVPEEEKKVEPAKE